MSLCCPSLTSSAILELVEFAQQSYPVDCRPTASIYDAVLAHVAPIAQEPTHLYLSCRRQGPEFPHHCVVFHEANLSRDWLHVSPIDAFQTHKTESRIGMALEKYGLPVSASYGEPCSLPAP